MITKRKPYTREIKASWWRQTPFYRFYMLREGTAVPAVWFSVLLMYALYALKNGEESWTAFTQCMAHPLMLVINFIVLLAALLQTKTWFVLAPKAARMTEAKEKLLVKLLWLLCGLASAFIIFMAL